MNAPAILAPLCFCQRRALSPPQYDTKPDHFYGTAEQPLSVDADAPIATIAVPEKASKATANNTPANP